MGGVVGRAVIVSFFCLCEERVICNMTQPLLKAHIM